MLPERVRYLFAWTAYALLIVAWAAAVGVGVSRLWAYESVPGKPAGAPLHWPAQSHLSRTEGLPTLVLLLHPQCPCSRATIGELARVMTQCDGKLNATVLVVRPEGFAEGWEKTDLWSSAEAIPGVKVLADEGGAESRLFGVATSGQTLLYSAESKLQFAGGITGSRGHSGDNAGRSALVTIIQGSADWSLKRPVPQVPDTPVYGCPLFDDSVNCQIQRGNHVPIND